MPPRLSLPIGTAGAGQNNGSGGSFDIARFSRWMRLLMVAFYSDEELVVIEQLIRRCAQVRDVVLSQALGFPERQVRSVLQRRLIPDGVVEREIEGEGASTKTFYRISPAAPVLVSSRLQTLEDTLTNKVTSEYECPGCRGTFDSLQAVSIGFRCNGCSRDLIAGENLATLQARLDRFRKQCQELLLLTRELRDVPVPYFPREEKKPTRRQSTVGHGDASPVSAGSASPVGGASPNSPVAAEPAPAAPTDPEPAGGFAWFDAEIVESTVSRQPGRKKSVEEARGVLVQSLEEDRTCALDVKFVGTNATIAKSQQELQGFYGLVTTVDDPPICFNLSFDKSSASVVLRAAHRDAEGFGMILEGLTPYLDSLLRITTVASVIIRAPSSSLAVVKGFDLQACRLLGYGTDEEADEREPGIASWMVTDPGKSKFIGARLPFTGAAAGSRACDSSVGSLAPDRSLELVARLSGRKTREPAGVELRVRSLQSGLREDSPGIIACSASFSEDRMEAVVRETFNDLAGFFDRLHGGSGPPPPGSPPSGLVAVIAEAKQSGFLTSLEFHGPSENVSRVEASLTCVGCVFFELDPGSLTWLVPQPSLLVRRARGAFTRDFAQKRLAERLRHVASEAGLRETSVTAHTSKASPTAASATSTGQRSGGAPSAEDVLVKGQAYSLSIVQGSDKLQDEMGDSEYEEFVRLDRNFRRTSSGIACLT